MSEIKFRDGHRPFGESWLYLGIMWTCTCGTIWLAALPLFWPIFRPFASNDFTMPFARNETVENNLPISSSSIVKIFSWCLFGRTRACPILIGYLSIKATNWLSSYILTALISLLIMEQKIHFLSDFNK